VSVSKSQVLVGANDSIWNTNATEAVYTHSSNSSVLIWPNFVTNTYGTSYYWKATITPEKADGVWGLTFKSIDADNMYFVRCTSNQIQFSACYNGSEYYWHVSDFSWVDNITKELKVRVDGTYYQIYVNEVLLPQNTVYSQSDVGKGASSGVVGLLAAGIITFQTPMFTSIEAVVVDVAECVTSLEVENALKILNFANSSYDFHISSGCKRSVSHTTEEEYPQIVINLYGNSSWCARALSSNLVSNIYGGSQIFINLTVTNVFENQSINQVVAGPSSIIDLPIQSPSPEKHNPFDGLTDGQTIGIIIGASGFAVFLIFVLLFVIVRMRKHAEYRGQQQMPEMQIMRTPQYPLGPLEVSSRTRKKKVQILVLLNKSSDAMELPTHAL